MPGYGKVDPFAQLIQVLRHPFHFLHVITNTFISYGKTLYHQFVGVLSWLDTPVPVWVTIVWGFSAFASLLLSDGKDIHSLSVKRYLLGVACMITSLLCLLMVMLSAYCIWMGVGAEVILLQGRYFHVIAVLFFLGVSLCMPSILSARNREQIKWGLVLSAGIINGSSFLMLLEKFWF